jgi:hypothetical protein
VPRLPSTLPNKTPVKANFRHRCSLHPLRDPHNALKPALQPPRMTKKAPLLARPVLMEASDAPRIACKSASGIPRLSTSPAFLAQSLAHDEPLLLSAHGESDPGRRFAGCEQRRSGL